MVQCDGDKDSDGDFTVTLKYRFLSPSGVPLDGTERLLRNDLDKHRLPRPGAPVAILYAHDGCHRAL